MRNSMPCLLLAGLALACAESPTQLADEVDFNLTVGSAANAAVHWNEIARELVSRNASSPYVAVRTYALVSIAQYHAATAVTAVPRRPPRAPVPVAITRASVDVLKYVYPGESAFLDSEAAGFIARQTRRGPPAVDVDAAQAAGGRAAEEIIVRARSDGFFAAWSGVVPTGPGIWFSSANPPAPPVLPLLGQALPFLLGSGDQFRPPPPPTFGSPQFQAALAEVRQVADTRTPEQDAIAKFWAFPAGTYAPPGFWNEEAAKLAVRHGLSERRTAHLLALVNMVGADALIAGHDAKYAYWLIRPSQADPGIKLAIGLPNFPSYVSNHAAVSGGMARILSTWFPDERRRLEGLAEEAAMSRLYGGIHYRFDNDAGLRVGRAIAAWALRRDIRDGRPFELTTR